MLSQVNKFFMLGAAFLGATQATPTDVNGILGVEARQKHLGLFYCTDANSRGTCTTRDVTGFDFQNIYVGDTFNDQISYIRLDSGTTCTFWMDWISGSNICGGSSFSYSSTSPIEDLGIFNSAFNDKISCFACH